MGGSRSLRTDFKSAKVLVKVKVCTVMSNGCKIQINNAVYKCNLKDKCSSERRNSFLTTKSSQKSIIYIL